MDVENETRPLLPPLGGESWRSRTRKRCMRIPSEITITGIILGLFLVVVTLLIVLQNMDAEKKDDITLDSNLLASPFKYNKKVEDKSWQDKKDKMKTKYDVQASPFKYNKKADDESWQEKKAKYKQKWDNVNKGWKQFPDISGKIQNREFKALQKTWKDNAEASDIPQAIDEYGKEIDDSLETFLELQMTDTSLLKQFNKDATEIKNLLRSKTQWKDVDEGWKTLSEQGWSDNRIKVALFKAIKEKRKELAIASSILQSPMTLDEVWDKTVENWKKNVKEGNEDSDANEFTDNKEAVDDKSNNEWKNEMSAMQSLTSSMKKYMKDDIGWQKLSEQGWKNKEIEEALIEAWTEQQTLQQSPMNIQSLWGKATEFFKSIFPKGMGEQKSHQQVNNGMENNLNLLQSYAKYQKIEELRKKLSKDDSKDKVTDKTEEEKMEPSQSPLDFEDFFGDLIEKIKEHKKKESKGTTDEPENENVKLSQSPIKFEDIMEDIMEIMKEHHKNGTDEQKSQKEINDEWSSKFNLLQPQMSSYKKWKKNEELKKKHSIDDWEDRNYIAIDEPLESPINFEGQLEDAIENKEHKKSGKTDDIKEAVNNAWKDGSKLFQSAMGNKDMKWKKENEGWKKIPNRSGKTDDIKEAVNNAWKDGSKLLQSAIGNKDMKWKKVNEGWKKISNRSMTVTTKCPLSKFPRRLQLGSVMTSPPIDCALITEEVRRKFGQCIDLSFLPKDCKPSWRVKCFSSYKYRKIDGTCNNQIHPTWGKSDTPFVRMIAPDYADGVSALRTAKDGGALPNSRLISRKLYSKQMKPDSDTSILFLYFGLLVDHDMVETAVDSDSIPCCDDNFILNPKNQPKECLQIDIPSDDPFYGPKNVKCLNLVRSIPINGVCGGRREQLNKATSFLDASVVYGSSINQAKQLRAFSKGQLKTQLINNTPFMSNAEGAGYKCGTPNEPLKCFEAGDSRVNMMVELTSMHTLWYREHNRIATELHKLNPQWQDELLFQEAKRILIAELQHITYNEFLPILLGENSLEQYELKIDEGKLYSGYDESVDPSIFNVFAAAAFRFGHSLVPDKQYLLGAQNSTVSKIPLHETFFNAELLYHNGLDLLLRGAAKQRTHSVDSYMSSEIREHLFQPANLDYGYDLAAVGIQRGRDHGLPPYTKWRSVCGLSAVKVWDDLYKVMDKERADAFKNVYQSVEDIDLIPGALAEHHKNESLVGPTYTCLIGRQFKKIRKGDRFWFEIQNEVGSLTKDQLGQIYKSNMARIICDNSDDIKAIQRYPLKIPSNNNPILDCEGIQKVDLSKWRSNF